MPSIVPELAYYGNLEVQVELEQFVEQHGFLNDPSKSQRPLNPGFYMRLAAMSAA